MSINNYNIDQQVKLIDLAEKVINYWKFRDSEDFEDYDQIMTAVEFHEKLVRNYLDNE